MFTKSAIPVLECRVCGHRFADYDAGSEHVQTNYGDDYFVGGKLGYPDYLAERHLLRRRGQRYAKILKAFTVPGRMLDVGAAAGFILEGFRDEEWIPHGIEPNESMAEYGQNKLQLSIHCVSLEDFQVDKPFDLVTMIQVIGHVVDPKQAAERLAALTRTRGLCLIESWDRNSLSARIFGSSWHEYSPPSVLHYFHHDGLVNLMQSAGFAYLRCGRMLKWIDGEHAKSLLNHKLVEFPAAGLCKWIIRLVPDRLAVPYPGEDLKWWLFEKR